MKEQIEVVSFDVDGTLVPMDFNNLIWMEELPSLIAKKKGMSLEDAQAYTISEYEKVGEDDLRWYEINYWIARFDLETSFEEILSKYESMIEVFPDVIPTLERLEDKYTLILTTAMPREFLDVKIKTIKQFFKFDFSVISDFKKLKTPDSYLTICDRLNVLPSELLHIGDHWEYDYIAPREAGANAIFLDREKKIVGDFIIHDLEELEL
ncbi:MAG: HAD family hydrolase [Pseudomonadota bacterium]